MYKSGAPTETIGRAVKGRCPASSLLKSLSAQVSRQSCLQPEEAVCEPPFSAAVSEVCSSGEPTCSGSHWISIAPECSFLKQEPTVAVVGSEKEGDR